MIRARHKASCHLRYSGAKQKGLSRPIFSGVSQRRGRMALNALEEIESDAGLYSFVKLLLT